MKRFHRNIIIILGFTIVSVFILYYFGLAHYLSLEHIKAHATFLKMQVTAYYFYAALLFIAIASSLLALTLPVTAPMGVLAGYLFGLVPGTLFCMLAIVVGASISFLVARYAFFHIMQHRYGQRLVRFKDRMQTYGYTYLITLQLLTIVPYFVINTLAALAGVPFFIFLLTTIIGSLPIVVIYVFAGQQLYLINEWKDILSMEMLLALFLLAALALLPMIVQRWRQYKGKYDEEDI